MATEPPLLSWGSQGLYSHTPAGWSSVASEIEGLLLKLAALEDLVDGEWRCGHAPCLQKAKLLSQAIAVLLLQVICTTGRPGMPQDLLQQAPQSICYSLAC